VLVCLANENAELECREFHVSMPITQSRTTDKYFLFLSSRRLYASSLLERNEGETTFEQQPDEDDEHDDEANPDKDTTSTPPSSSMQ
jgi:hypothetical protein